MEKFLSSEYGLVGICIFLTIHILLKVGEFVWAIKEKKESVTEATTRDLIKAVQANTVATQHLENRMEHLEKSAADLPKFKLDMRRFYAAIKEVAGDRWPMIREEIMKDDFTP